jgi:hypothetical protein
MMGQKRIGWLQREIRRAFIASRGEPVTTAQLLRICWPGDKRPYEHYYNRCRSLRRAAARFAVVAAQSPRGHHGPTLFAPTDTLRALIRGK